MKNPDLFMIFIFTGLGVLLLMGIFARLQLIADYIMHLPVPHPPSRIGNDDQFDGKKAEINN